MIPRVLLVSCWPSPLIRDLIDAINNRGSIDLHTVFLAPNSGGERSWGSFPPRANWRVLSNNVFKRRAELAELLSNRAWDVVIYSATYWRLEAWYIRRRATVACIPLIFYNEPIDVSRHPLLLVLKKAILKWYLRPFVAIWATGRHSAAGYRHLVGVGPFVGNLGYVIDLSALECISQTTTSTNRLRIVFSGQLIKRKNLEQLLHACAALSIPYHLKVFGAGPYDKSLKLLASKLSLQNVEFCGEAPFTARVNMFRDADVLVLPSLHDGWGMVVHEALAAGVPVIASTRVMSAQEFVRSGENGYLVEVADNEGLARKLESLYHALPWYDDLREGARRSVRGYTPEEKAELVNSLIGEALKLHASRVPLKVNSGELRDPSYLGSENSRHIVRAAARSAALRVLGSVARKKTQAGLTVLVYHFVLRSTEANFVQQLGFFKDNFVLVSLEEGVEQLKTEIREPMLAITFDDGFEECIQRSAPLLEAAGVKGTYFVPTLLLDPGEDWNVIWSRRFHLSGNLCPPSQDVIRDAQALGHHFELHGHSHLSLARMPLAGARADVARAQQRYKAYFGRNAKYLALPYGERPAGSEFDSMLSEAGIEAAFTLRRGANSGVRGPYALGRDHVEGDWSLKDLSFFLGTSR